MPIEFKKLTVFSKFSPPGSRGTEHVQELEYRRDPLTGRWCRINIERARRPKQASGDLSTVMEAAERARSNCPFCPERIENSTPTFTQLPYERLRRGNCWVFPNLFPFSKNHAVTVFTPDHFKPLHGISADEIVEGMMASIEYLSDLKKVDPSARYPLIAWNNLPPAGASIIHPHFQVLADEVPVGQLRQELEASESYRSEGGCFWKELIEVEGRTGERVVKDGRSIAWLTPFAPQGNREVLAVFRGKSSLINLSISDIREFADGLLGILKYYSESGVLSLNLALFSGPLDEDVAESFYLHARIIARPSPTTLYVNDDGFMEKLCTEPVIDMTPEDLAKSLRKYLT